MTHIYFRPPVLPVAPREYDHDSFDRFSNVLRIYFNQLDNALKQAMADEVPYNLRVARGDVAGASTANLYGYNAAVGTTYVAPWSLAASTQYVVPSSAVVMALVSDNAGDTAVVVTVNGLDANYAILTEDVTLNGVTPVNTTGTYLRINSITALASTVLGTISMTNGGVTYADIAMGEGKSQMAQYTIPAGYSLFVSGVDAWSTTASGGTSYLTYRTLAAYSTGATASGAPVVFSTVPMRQEYVSPLKYTEKTSLQFQVVSSLGTNDVTLTVESLLIAN